MTIRTEVVSSVSAAENVELHALFRAVYADDRGWMANASATLLDDFHAQSTYVLLTLDTLSDAPRLVGAARLVHDGPSALPVERFFPLAPLKRGHRVGEIQRLMVAPDLRSRRVPGAPFGLLARLMRDLLRHAVCEARITMMIVDLFADSQLSPVNPLRQLGFEQIGCTFVDEELACPVPSMAMVLDGYSLSRAALTSGGSKFVQYVLNGATPSAPILEVVPTPASGEHNAHTRQRFAADVL